MTAQVQAGEGAPVAGSERLVTFDFIRGVAVLGILFANIVAFGHPRVAYSWPGALPDPLGRANEAVWLAQYVFIDGKMRGLFTLLFGAGLALFMDRAWARGETRWLQLRRLLWLGAFGLAHFFFLFWGDILFLYAQAGIAVLPLLRLPGRTLLRIGLLWYAIGSLIPAAEFASTVLLEQSPAAQRSQPADYRLIETRWSEKLQGAQVERAAFEAGSYPAEIRYIAVHEAPPLFEFPWFAVYETIPLMLIGIALFRRGLFGGATEGEAALDPARLRKWGWAGFIGGALVTLPLGLWAIERGFAPWLTEFIVLDTSQFPRLAMILGLAVLLAAAAPKAAAGWLGSRLVAAGRMAFSNYVGTSAVMMLVFRHWAGGQYGELDRAWLLAPVLLGWVLMLAWSKPWLAHFRYGPLEWAWRCLTYWKWFPMRR